MNGHFGLCSQWKSRCLETLMQLDIYLLGSRSDVIDCGVASFAYESESVSAALCGPRCLVPRPHYSARPKRFGPCGPTPRQNVYACQFEHFRSLFQSHFPVRSKVSRVRSASFCVQLVVRLFCFMLLVFLTIW